MIFRVAATSLALLLGSACSAGPETAPVDRCAEANGGCGDPAYWACTNGTAASPTCTDLCAAPVGSLVLPVAIRDFMASHPDFEKFLGVDLGIVASVLDGDGLPVYANAAGSTPTTTGKASFDQWYRDVPGVNVHLDRTLTLAELVAGTQQFSSTAYFPIDAEGLGNEGNAHNFHFTTVVRVRFRYAGGESIAFTGDDDAWLFVNGQLAINLGGVHGPMSGSVDLDGAASALGLSVGEVYEAALFQAERHTTASNYQLTLAGLAVCP